MLYKFHQNPGPSIKPKEQDHEAVPGKYGRELEALKLMDVDIKLCLKRSTMHCPCLTANLFLHAFCKLWANTGVSLGNTGIDTNSGKTMSKMKISLLFLGKIRV